MDAPTQTLDAGRSLRGGGAVRASARGISLVLSTSVFYAILLAGRLPARLAGSADAWTQGVFSAWARTVLRILGLRLRVRGTPPVPPFMLVSNHLSYIDVLVLAAIARPVFIARSDVSRWPLVGRLAASVATIFVDRGLKRDLPRVAAAIEDRLGRGLGVVLFAEGTSTDGADVLPFKPSLLAPASRTGRPTHYASLSYEASDDAPPARLSVCWWGDMEFWPHLLGLLRIRRIDACVTFGHEPIASTDRRILAEELWQAVRRQYRPLSR
jgi:1-acyl-sn-glycerol-3-phosphate acyltransferase